ncbi:MAG: hypothetical protein QF541_05380 [Lentisphaeria bacterium]|jgi:hypothetical protein|nr:hypothetical protein [Lentisphaeria bacterium]
MADLKQQLELCVEKLRSGLLTEHDLQHVLESLGDGDGNAAPQRLLYLQSENTMITSKVIGIAVVDRDGVHDGPDDPDEWPYQTVHEALLDGWRIIKFPEMALMMSDEETPYGLGCEFILEK